MIDPIAFGPLWVAPSLLALDDDDDARQGRSGLGLLREGPHAPALVEVTVLPPLREGAARARARGALAAAATYPRGLFGRAFLVGEVETRSLLVEPVFPSVSFARAFLDDPSADGRQTRAADALQVIGASLRRLAKAGRDDAPALWVPHPLAGVHIGFDGSFRFDRFGPARVDRRRPFALAHLDAHGAPVAPEQRDGVAAGAATERYLLGFALGLAWLGRPPVTDDNPVDEVLDAASAAATGAEGALRPEQQALLRGLLAPLAARADSEETQRLVDDAQRALGRVTNQALGARLRRRCRDALEEQERAADALAPLFDRLDSDVDVDRISAGSAAAPSGLPVGFGTGGGRR